MAVTYRKIFLAHQYQKEEDWLNRMSDNGLQLIDPGFINYTFTEGEKGEYQYRIEMLPHFPYHPESQKYIHFIEDTGAEYVGSVKNWVYFRKKTSEGPFELFSDLTAKIRHFRRINLTLWLCLFFLILYPCIFVAPNLIKKFVPYPVAAVIKVNDITYLVSVQDEEEYPEVAFPYRKKGAPYTVKKTDIPVMKQLPHQDFDHNLTIVAISSGLIGDYSPWRYREADDAYILKPNKAYTNDLIATYSSLFVVLLLYLPIYVLLICGLVKNGSEISYLKKEKRIRE